MLKHQFQDHERRIRKQRDWLHKASFFSLLLLIGMACSWATGIGGDSSGVATASMGFMGGSLVMLRKEADELGGGGGGGALPEEKFQEKVLGGIKSHDERLTEQRKEISKMTEDFDRLDKSTKKEFETLREVREKSQGLDSDLQQTLLQVRRVQNAIANEKRMAFGDPLQRISADPEKRTLLSAVMKTYLAKSRDNVAFSDAEKKILESGSSPGSTLLNDDLYTDVYDLLDMYGIANTFDMRTVSTKNNKFLVKTARPIAKVFGEGVTITEDTTKAGTSVTQTAAGIKVLLGVANELLEDSEIDLTHDIMVDFAQAVSYREDFLCLQADGTNDDLNGAMTGIFPGGTDVVAAAGNTTMETVDFEDVTAVMLGVPAAVATRPHRWWLHPHILVRFLHIKDANGRPIFLTAQEAPTPNALGSILGAPTTLANAAPSANTAGSRVAAYGDPGGMVVGRRKGFEFATSEHHKFEDYETTFRGVSRFGNKIRLATAFGILKLAAV